ncbi:dihydrodipicolinate synthase [Desulfomicrobium apsheronum]|uniref:4-hydroxy-tetrahydrodipicolinate synthase n=1 Tax=Desulfomicrobium apsheronum TaxID=52560 RepID=A0A1I3QL17_9BACT|nr:4-hydroxy-tetrahydrodipicolinate synthase [Desulfomicrobium apsheronum]MDY0225267.1 4-hydroxy-tetrahydrodipicolinate synthase [Desulfomicrobium apsheronum]SFJ33981.1 dihydrodipicolinate synthase [Desulfomicrobium apsheronum]
MQFKGAFTALVTPFSNGQLDEEAYRQLIEWQIQSGINGVVPCGTTGESATMSHDEHKRVIRICVDQVKGRVPVLAGAGSNNTAEAVELTRFAKEAGADGALLITPYYNKPTQEGLYQHFKRIAEEVSMPFILYNVPGRTSVNMLPHTVARLNKDIPDVVGIKEATGDLSQVSQVLEFCGPDFQVLSGDDFTVLPLLSVGGCGVISVVSNILPDKMSALCSAWFAADLPKAREMHFLLASFSRMMFIETNPIPVKTSLSLMGRINLEMRLPLTPMSPANAETLRGFLADKGLI